MSELDSFAIEALVALVNHDTAELNHPYKEFTQEQQDVFAEHYAELCRRYDKAKQHP